MNLPKTSILLGISLLILFFSGHGKASTQAELVKSADPAKCAECHGDDPVLPKGHPDTANMVLRECRDCHQDMGLSLGHIHTLAGNDCETCHMENPAEAPTMEDCFACHEDYAESENYLNPTLPKVHDSHMGDLACDLCHKIHGKSENFCAQCHDWNYIVP